MISTTIKLQALQETQLWLRQLQAKKCAFRHWSGLSLYAYGLMASLNILMDSKDPEETSDAQHYENSPIQRYWKFYHQKTKIFREKKSDIFRISAQNINCGYTLEPPRRGGSNAYPQSMFWNTKNNVYPCKPQFYYITVGFKGVKII